MDEAQNLVKKDNQVNGDSKSESDESSMDTDYGNSNSKSDSGTNGETLKLENDIDKLENGDSRSTSKKLDNGDSNGDTESEENTETKPVNSKTNEKDGAETKAGKNVTKSSNEESKSTSHDDSIDQNNKIPAKKNNDLGLPQDFSMKSKTIKAVPGNVNGDSDKENVDADGPMDLSAPMDLSVGSKPKKAASDPDIIMLSDDSSDEVAQAAAKRLEDMTPEEIEERKKLIRKRQNELRNEEAKLVLLKKIRQSQSVPASSESQQSAPSKVLPRGPAPPPLTRGGIPMDRDRDRDRKPNVPPQLHRAHQQPSQARSTTQPPPLVMAPQRQQNMHSSGATPNNYLQSHRPVQQPTPPVDTQTPAQRQAAAKLALRKQLEKTLLQIPPPKPPPPEMNFVPSLASNEFIYLIGLEEAVKFITDTDAKAKGQMADVKYIFNPFTCVQCGSDFTPVWKRDKPGSKNVICEQCVTTNQKKALKQEHTNRLKSAFVKALQQEQEIEQRMQQQQKSAAAAASSSTVQHHATSAPSTTTATFTSTAHQNLVPAHAHSSRPSSSQGSHINIPAYNPRLTFPYQVGYKPQDNAHRQYLLDMIPRSNTVLWKS